MWRGARSGSSLPPSRPRAAGCSADSRTGAKVAGSADRPHAARRPSTACVAAHPAPAPAGLTAPTPPHDRRRMGATSVRDVPSEPAGAISRSPDEAPLGGRAGRTAGPWCRSGAAHRTREGLAHNQRVGATTKAGPKNARLGGGGLGGLHDGPGRAGATVQAFNDSAATRRTDTTDGWRFNNQRSASYWNVRELLDAALGGWLALPPDDDLAAELPLASTHPRSPARGSSHGLRADGRRPNTWTYANGQLRQGHSQRPMQAAELGIRGLERVSPSTISTSPSPPTPSRAWCTARTGTPARRSDSQDRTSEPSRRRRPRISAAVA